MHFPEAKFPESDFSSIPKVLQLIISGVIISKIIHHIIKYHHFVINMANAKVAKAKKRQPKKTMKGEL